MVAIEIGMPTDCYSCWIRKNIGCSIADESGWLIMKRDDDCPLIQLKQVDKGEGTCFIQVGK